MNKLTKQSIKILGSGSYFPKQILTNHDLKINTTIPDNKWIIDKLGIHQRHKVTNEKTSELGAKSALKAMKNCNLNINDIDLIITVTSTPDRISPSTACIIQDILKPWKNIPAFDINAVCSGFLYGLDIGSQLLNKYNNILIISTETYSTITDYNNRDCVFFGDGSASVIITKGNSGWFYCNIYSNGSGKENFTVKHNEKFQMNGKEVYNTGIKVLPECISKTLNDLNMSIDDVDYFVPHQPSHNILKKTCSIVGLSEDKMLFNMNNRANTAGASIPTVLDELLAKKPKNGDNILFASVGSGWTWGAGVLCYES